MKKLLWVFVLMFGAGLLLAPGCGKKDDKKPAPPPDQPIVPEAPPGAPGTGSN